MGIRPEKLLRPVDLTGWIKKGLEKRKENLEAKLEKLELSRRYWQQQGISDWGIIIDKEDTSHEES